MRDPFLIVVNNNYVIPLLSNHIGGGNYIGRILAINLNKKIIYSTATDLKGKVGIDELCRTLFLELPKKKDILRLNKELLERDLELYLPEGWNIKINGYKVSYHDKDFVKVEDVKLKPLKVSVGVGCRRGIESFKIYWAVKKALYLRNIPSWRIDIIGTINLREREVKEGCKRFNREILTFTKEELNEAVKRYNLERSEFVYKHVGTYGVAEPSALLGLESLEIKGKLILKKLRVRGVTVAIASHPTYFI
ncbi:cobalamin biosynthesis protein [Methanocaldococcus infernus]